MELIDADTTSIQEIGIKGALLEKLFAAQVYTAGQLSRWLRSAHYAPIRGLGREHIAKLSDLLISHQIKNSKLLQEGPHA